MSLSNINYVTRVSMFEKFTMGLYRDVNAVHDEIHKNGVTFEDLKRLYVSGAVDMDYLYDELLISEKIYLIITS